MNVQYDQEVDALYLRFSDQVPDGVIEMAEGVNLDTTAEGKITGIEILQASKKLNVDTILSYVLELDQGFFKKKVA
ncbi:DUF2283 domain-containing protein [Chromatium okenii]|jgi:uncharacterized protein YuzE|uniref:DUF2283 domain-containing protein n=1 Tax=Chromatium okenii TaxID=61644 RepID=A0A2S7XU32_9GAMM|nr:DUF2283 domain-containing protein [Chromatium okenii]MBV5308497.1 DUF2283 domain-containing protein [Chromatium okenii]PQJ96998.1 hypothetical protein CXB77_04560 [Chromatium okenii]